MCMEATIAQAGGAGQGTTIVASDSGSWRGPWRWVRVSTKSNVFLPKVMVLC